MESQETEDSWAWRLFSQWPVVVLISIGLLVLTVNPLLTGVLPYLRAGWPAARTAFWLKGTDPWKARGTVGLLFHLCMALFCAGAWAFLFVLVTGVVASCTKQQPDLVPMMIAISIIALGCCLSSVLGWIGIAIALRHRVRMFVKSNLYAVCRGDFTVATTLGPNRTGTNPANFILVVTTVAPLLGIWLAIMLIQAPAARINQPDATQLVLMILLPVLVVIGAPLMAFLSRRIAAHSPAECWGAAAPITDVEPANWYQATD